VIDWSPLLVIPNGRFSIPCRGWITAFNISADPETAASMGLHHALVRMQFRLPSVKEVTALMPPVWSLRATPLSANDRLRYARPRSLQQRLVATTPFLEHTRPFAPSRSFTMHPPPPLQRPVPPSVRICCATLSNRHPFLQPAEPLAPPPDPRSSQCRHPAGSGRASHPFTRSRSALCRRTLQLFQCRHAGAYLDTVPVTPYLRLFDADLINCCYFRLGATGNNPHVPTITGFCGRHIQGSDIDHAMSCNRLSGSRSHRHDLW
jgi:hypothetical protein